MRRFFCQKCNKIKHVRVMPSSVKTPLAENPRDRVGECRWHSAGSPHAFFAANQPPKPLKPVKVKKQPEVPTEGKRKKGGK